MYGPIIVIHFYCTSEAQRLAMTRNALNHLEPILNKTRVNYDLDYEMRLECYFYYENSNCGEIWLYEKYNERKTHKSADFWCFIKNNLIELLKKDMCSSVWVAGGDVVKNIFGLSFRSLLIAKPDFAKLTKLDDGRLLNHSKIQNVIDGLNRDGDFFEYNIKDQINLLSEAKNDPRFMVAFRKKEEKLPGFCREYFDINEVIQARIINGYISEFKRHYLK